MAIVFAGHIGYDDMGLADGILQYIPIFEEAGRVGHVEHRCILR